MSKPLPRSRSRSRSCSAPALAPSLITAHANQHVCVLVCVCVRGQVSANQCICAGVCVCVCTRKCFWAKLANFARRANVKRETFFGQQLGTWLKARQTFRITETEIHIKSVDRCLSRESTTIRRVKQQLISGGKTMTGERECPEKINHRRIPQLKASANQFCNYPDIVKEGPYRRNYKGSIVMII